MTGLESSGTLMAPPTNHRLPFSQLEWCMMGDRETAWVQRTCVQRATTALTEGIWYIMVQYKAPIRMSEMDAGSGAEITASLFTLSRWQLSNYAESLPTSSSRCRCCVLRLSQWHTSRNKTIGARRSLSLSRPTVGLSLSFAWEKKTKKKQKIPFL